MAAVEADPTQPSTETIKSIKGTRSVNSLYQFDYTYKVKEPGKPSKEKTATETVSAFSIGEAKDKAKAAISKDLGKTPNVLQSTLKIEKPLVKGQFAVTELSGKKANEAAPKIVMNPSTPEKFQSMFDAVDAALESVKDSPTLGLDSDGWIKAFSRSLNGSKGSVPPAPLRLAKWVQDNASFKSFIDEGLKRNPELIQSAVNGLNALQPIHEMARQSMIHPKMVALHMFWGLLSRMLDPYNQEAGWARLTSDPKVLRLLEDSVDGKYQSTKDEWKAIVSSKMSEFPDVKIGRNAIQNANAFHEMLSRWNGRWTELADIINNPDLDGPQMRRAFNKQGFGGAGIKHKVLSFVIATLARNDVFVGDRWQVVNLWFPHLEKAAASRKAAGGDGEVFAYDKNGVPEDTTGAYKVIGGMLNSETVAETGYSLIENGMKKIAADSPWLREMLGREPQPFDIHWLTWNIIKNEPVGHSSLDATGKFLTENLYGDPRFAQKFAETEKRTEKYAKGVFDVFSVKGQERPQIRQRSSSQYAGSGEAGIRPDAVGLQGGSEGPSAAGTAGEVAGQQRFMPASDMASGRSVKDYGEAVDLFEKGYRIYGAPYDGMEDPIRLKKVTEIENYDPENLWAVPSKKIAAAIGIRNMPASDTDIYRAGDKSETGVKAFSSWSENKSTAEAYLDNPGFGGAVLRSEKVPLNSVLDADTTNRKGMERLARQLGFDAGTGDEWFDNGWKYPWEESKSVKEALKKSGFDAIRYSDDFPEGATSIVPLKDFAGSENNRFMPSPDSAMPGAYSFSGGYRALPGKAKGSFRIYGPAGSLLGIASSLDEAQRILRRKTK
jgi:hypothetical protein